MTSPRNETIRPDAPVLRRRATTRSIAILAGVLLLAGVGILLGLRVAVGGVLPGVHVAGTDVSGLSRAELATTLEPLVSDAAVHPVRYGHEGATLEVRPADVGWAPSLDGTVDAAWQHGREGNVLARSWSRVASLWRTVEVPLQGDLDPALLETRLDEVETTVSSSPFPGGISVDPSTLDVITEAPRRGFAADRGALAREIPAALAAPGIETLEVPGTFVDPVTTEADVALVAEQAQQAVSVPFEASIPVVEDVVTLTPAEIAPLLGAGLDADGRLVLTVDPVAVETAFGGRIDLLEVAPRDASWALPRDPGVTLDDKGDVTWEPERVTAPVVASRPGHEFDADAVATQMGEVLRAGGHEASFDLPLVDPDFTTADARAFGITELLGTFTSYHAPGEPRVTNIQTLADVVDGTRIAPGEQFSINQLSGERTCERGYVEDAMILNHRMVDVCGGGVSQFGSTMLNAAFFAGVQLDAHQAHSHYISRYPMGREATLNYPSPDIDVRWTNDTGHGIWVRTAYTDTSITVSLYGTSDVVEVSARHSAPFRHRQAPVEYVEDPTLDPGTSRVVESGIDGFDMEVTRLVRHADGEVTRDEIFTRYVTIPSVVRRNSETPEPEPTPTPSPDGSPAPSPAPGPSPAPSAPADGAAGGEPEPVDG